MGLARRIKKQVDKLDIKPENIGIENSLIPSADF